MTTGNWYVPSALPHSRNKFEAAATDSVFQFGRVVDGEVSKLVGKKCDKEGKIWSDSGKVIGNYPLIIRRFQC